MVSTSILTTFSSKSGITRVNKQNVRSHLKEKINLLEIPNIGIFVKNPCYEQKHIHYFG